MNILKMNHYFPTRLLDSAREAQIVLPRFEFPEIHQAIPARPNTEHLQRKDKFSVMIHKLLILLLVSASWTMAQQPPQSTPGPTPAAMQPQTKSTYETLLERVKKNDQTVDFKELRLAYTETREYSPYGGDSMAKKKMFEALKQKDYDQTLTNATTMLSANYLDIMGHFGSFVAQRELGHADLSVYHRWLFESLLNSIKNSGDGKTAETAFVVISTDEEYALFNYLGLRPQDQTLVKEKDHSYDRMTALDPQTNQTVVYYFNIDKTFNWLGNSLKKVN
jgi:hypothetical protein